MLPFYSVGFKDYCALTSSLERVGVEDEEPPDRCDGGVCVCAPAPRAGDVILLHMICLAFVGKNTAAKNA